MAGLSPQDGQPLRAVAGHVRGYTDTLPGLDYIPACPGEYPTRLYETILPDGAVNGLTVDSVIDGLPYFVVAQRTVAHLEATKRASPKPVCERSGSVDHFSGVWADDWELRYPLRCLLKLSHGSLAVMIMW